MLRSGGSRRIGVGMSMRPSREDATPESQACFCMHAWPQPDNGSCEIRHFSGSQADLGVDMILLAKYPTSFMEVSFHLHLFCNLAFFQVHIGSSWISSVALYHRASRPFICIKSGTMTMHPLILHPLPMNKIQQSNYLLL